LQAHCQSPTSQSSTQALLKSLQSQRKKNFKKNYQPFKKIKNSAHYPTDNDTKTKQGQWFTDTDVRTPAANISFAKWRVKRFYDNLAQVSSSVF
jgi:hypothetical protein